MECEKHTYFIYYVVLSFLPLIFEAKTVSYMQTYMLKILIV